MLTPARLISFLLIAVAVSMGFDSYATQEKYINRASGDKLPLDSTIAIKDTGFTIFESQIEQDYLRQNVISVFLNEDVRQYISSAFTARIYVEYTFENYLHQSNAKAATDSFTISYDSTRSFGTRDYRVFKDIFSSRVKITRITANVSWDVRKFIAVSNELYIQRSYRWANCSTTDVPALTNDPVVYSTDNENTEDRCRVRWGAVLGADEYDLEWTYRDADAGGTLPVLSGSIFTNSATRVSINAFQYRIPLLFEGAGRLYYRVRPVKIRPDGQRIEGRWSSDNPATGIRFVDFSGFQKKLNWQSTVSFAEEGKNKAVVSYFDGSLRSRQMVTRDNTTDTAIVAETFYDYQGRASIQVLPTPSLSSLVTYAKDFNRNSINNTAYETDDFDKLGMSEAACGKAAAGMSNQTSGAANYYSPNNPLLSRAAPGYHRFIPDANGYPFTQTEYTLDNTGRIARQGGVGMVHQLGRQDTRYFYGKPSQEELDALFGTEAGYAGHYFKNMVRDANGQYSISYQDMHGRTVATSLAGTPPDSIRLEKLGTNVSDIIYESLIEPNSQVIDGYAIKTTKSLVMPKAGDITIAYQLKAPRLSIADCKLQNICYDCLYDLNLKVTNDCGDTYLDILLPKIGVDTSNNPSGVDTVCNAPDSVQYSKTLNLPEGSYMITKTLTVRKESLDKYRDSLFLAHNLCKTYQSFLKEAILEVKSDANCVPTCADCNAALGTQQAFIGRYMQQMGIATTDSAAHYTEAFAAYEEARNTCNKLCTDSLGDDDAIRQEMLLDMTPEYGQYARNDSAYRVEDPLNIFYTNYYYEPNTGTFYTIQNFQQQYIHYEDENGLPDRVVNSQGNQVLPNQLTEAEFVSLFKPSWAKALLNIYHQDRLKLAKATEWRATYQYDERLKGVDTYAEALAKGYLNPTGEPSLAGQFNPNGITAASVDPALQLAIFPNPGDLWNAITHYQYNPDPNSTATLNIWTLAYQMVVCTDPNSACFNDQAISSTFSAAGCPGDLDMAWRNFRALYLQIKAQLIYRELNKTAIIFDPHSYTPPGGTTPYARYETRFPDPSSAGGIAGIDPHTSTQSQIESQLSAQQVQELVAANCNSYVDTWMQTLAACHYSDIQWAQLKDKLLQICKSGGDIDHIGGASTYGSANNATNSFVEAVNDFNNTFNITTTAACNGYLLTVPPPYNAPLTTQVNQQVFNAKEAGCLCTNLSKYHGLYQAEGLNGESFGGYLRRRLQISISDADISLLDGQCNSTSGCRYLANAISVPPALTVCTASGYASPCIGCLKADSLFNQFLKQKGAAYPTYDNQDSSQQANNRYFSTYMNHQTGFNYTAAEYLQFLDDCKARGELYRSSCDSFRQLIAGFQATEYSSTNCDSAIWKIYESYYSQSPVAPVCDGVSDGNLHVPPSQTNRFMRFDMIDTAFCWPDEFAVEARIQTPGVNAAYNIGVGIVYQNANGQDIVSPRRYLSFALPSPQYTGNANYSIDGQVTSSPGTAVDLTSWRVIRIEKGEAEYKCYIDGTMMFRVGIPDEHRGQKHARFSMIMFQNALQVDWVRMFAKQGSSSQYRMIYDEEFNTPQSFARPSRKYSCSYDCRAAFAAYYNQRSGTSLTFDSIDNRYRQSCGTSLNVCSDQSDCDEMDRIINEYRYRLLFDSCSAGKWHMNRGFTNTQLQSFCNAISNGVMKVPSSAQNAGAIAFDYIDTNLCMPDRYSIQTSVKAPGGQNRYNFDIGIIYQDGSGHDLPGKFISFSFGPPGVEYAGQYNLDGEKISAPALAASFTSSRLVRIDRFAGSYFVYIDGQLVLMAPCPAGHQGQQHIRLSMLTYYSTFEADWVQIKDLNPDQTVKRMVYDEEFNAARMAKPAADYQCANSCEQNFARYYNSVQGTALTYAQIRDLYKQNCNKDLDVCTPTGPLQLCGRSNALFPDAVPGDTTDCYDTTALATIKATIRYNAYRDSLKNTFDSMYLRRCLQAAGLEQLHLTRPINEYHYTLYYYDQAGNLVKTVPPAGVYRFSSPDSLSMVQNARNTRAAAPIVPPHGLATTYRYNSLNQVVAQQTPDAGVSRFWYDLLGRLVLSRNARQRAGLPADTAVKMYSYTLYDYIGRITEVGELLTRDTTPGQKTVVRDPAALAVWLNSYTRATANAPALYRRQITRTVYDVAQAAGQLPVQAWFAQKNLRNRVSYSQVIDQDAAPLPADLHGTTTGTARAATYYSYDVHGNVYKLLQHYNAGVMKDNPASSINQYKLVAYDYDLISGKVNQVSYQPSYVYNNNLVVFPDRFFHRYSYDAENRLTHVYTSPDSVYWELDARYDYYRHGPLARTVLGQQQVQGVDYAYTLQGWLKGVNGTSAPTTGGSADMGGDAATATSVARDAYSYSLHYHRQDYQPIGGAAAQLLAPVGAAELGNDYRPLYNGNISSMAVNLPALGSGSALLYNYQYDQLNRLVKMDAWTGLNTTANSWAGALKGEAYQERVRYDANGNILAYFRNGGRPAGTTLPLAMDDLAYSYYPGTNRLQRVRDAVGSTAFNTDIDDQPDEQNYVYDAIGNLVTDKAAQLKTAEWNVYGKLLSVEKGTDASALNNVRTYYTYDAAGMRLSKQVQQPGQQGVEGLTTWYVRDAQGNVLSTYTYGNGLVNEGLLTQSEVHLYGSSRLGMWQPNRNVQTAYTEPLTYVDLNGTLSFGNIRSYLRGKKVYELSNHLGNVLATVSDKKFGVAAANGTDIDYYKPDVVSASDYYPFGMVMPARNTAQLNGTATTYRYGFNGKELDNDINGDDYDFGARIYDGRLGRWLSTDPLQNIYAGLSPYCAFGNSPIWLKDPDGKKVTYSTDPTYNGIWEPQTIHDLAQASYNFTNIKVNKNAATGKYDVELVFNIAYSNLLTMAAKESVEAKYPGLFTEVKSHEESHIEQYFEAAVAKNVSVIVNGRTITDKADNVINQAFGLIDQDANKKFDQLNSDIKAGKYKSQKEVDKVVQAISQQVANSKNEVVKKVSKQLQENINAVYDKTQLSQKMSKQEFEAYVDSVENDANKRATKKLGGESKIKYLNGHTLVKYKNKVLPN